MRISCFVCTVVLLTSTAWAGSSGQDIQAPSIVTAGVPFAISITPNCPETEPAPRYICVPDLRVHVGSTDPLATIPSGTFTTNPNQTTNISQPMVMRTLGLQRIEILEFDGLQATVGYVTVNAPEQLSTLGTGASLLLVTALVWYGTRRVALHS